VVKKNLEEEASMNTDTTKEGMLPIEAVFVIIHRGEMSIYLKSTRDILKN